MWVSLIESLSKMHLPPLSKQEFCQQTTFGLKWHPFLGSSGGLWAYTADFGSPFTILLANSVKKIKSLFLYICAHTHIIYSVSLENVN